MVEHSPDFFSFNQSSAEQNYQLQLLLQSTERTREAFDWYRQVASALITYQIPISDFEATPIAIEWANNRAKLKQEALYFFFVLQQAIDSLMRIIPSLSATLVELVPYIVLTRSKVPELPRSFDSNYISVGPLHGIKVQKPNHKSEIDYRHPFRVLASGHELLHSIVTMQLGVPARIPGYSKRYAWAPQSYEEAERFRREAHGNLCRVILEAAGLAYEHEFLSQVFFHSEFDAGIEQLEKFARARVRHFRRANHLWLPDYRKRLGLDNEASSRQKNFFTPEKFPELNYSEGFQLAVALRRNGWQLSELPEIIERIRQEIPPEDALHTVGETLLYTPISHQKKSPYVKIIQQIRPLEK